jgi:hypothetical protein
MAGSPGGGITWPVVFHKGREHPAPAGASRPFIDRMGRQPRLLSLASAIVTRMGGDYRLREVSAE